MYNTNKQRINENVLEPIEMLLKLKLETRMQKTFETTAAQYAQFWDTLQDRSPIYDRFFGQGEAIAAGNRKVDSLWKKLLTLRGGRSSRTTYLYYIFARDVMNSQRQTDDILRVSADDSCRLSQFAEPDEPVVGVSALEKSLGKILRVNRAFCQFSGYTPQELQGTPVEKLVPPMFRRFHQMGFIDKCYESDRLSEVAQSSLEVFVLLKSGYVVPCEIQIIEAPTVLSLYCFMARMKPKTDKCRHEVVHILTDEKGMIKNTSSSIPPVMKCSE